MTKDSLARHAKNRIVIECESGGLEGRMPLSGFCVILRRRLSRFIKQCSKDHGYRMTPRVAPWITERADLFKLNSRKASLFVQLTSGGCFKRFVFVDKPARECPDPFKRFVLALDEQDASAATCAMQKNDVDRDRWTRMIVAVFSRRRRCLHQSVSVKRSLADRIAPASS
jgi:hypothetical protein